MVRHTDTPKQAHPYFGQFDALTLEESATTVVADRGWALPADEADAATTEDSNGDDR